MFTDLKGLDRYRKWLSGAGTILLSPIHSFLVCEHGNQAMTGRFYQNWDFKTQTLKEWEVMNYFLITGVSLGGRG